MSPFTPPTHTDQRNNPLPREGYGLARPANVDAPRVLRAFQIVSVQNDYLVVNPFNGDGTVNTNRTKFVLKPWTLQTTPFEGMTINGVTYAYTGFNERTATDGSTTETQLITQDYYAGALIYAIQIQPKFQIQDGTPNNGKYTALLDANNDARAWAVQ